MVEKLTRYRLADTPVPEKQRLMPLYGAGFENLGENGNPIEAPVPEIGPDELLVRHDAVGLCFSDIKVIRLGQDHPRIYREMKSQPVVLGHEVSLTVVRVGEHLRNQYKPGDRFIMQSDIFVNGVGYAYGYEIQGGLSQFNKIDARILNGDDGNYLVSVKPTTGFAESALSEPWACVIAAYQLKYRTGLKPGGVTWIIGSQQADDGARDRDARDRASRSRTYTISAGFDRASHPARLLLSRVPAAFASELKACAADLKVEVTEFDITDVDGIGSLPVDLVDDIVILGADADLIEAASPHLANHGIMAILADRPLDRKVNVDVGRIHYNRWVYTGSTGTDIARAYADVPVRSTLKPGGRAWFVGAGGPMGHMHVQHALVTGSRPGAILCTGVQDARLDDLCTAFSVEAESQGIRWLCLNPKDREAYQKGLAEFAPGGFDDIIVLAPVPAVVSEAAAYLAPNGVMNVFAGLNRGTMAELDLSDAYLKNTRVIGHSASTISDLRFMLHQAESGELSPNRSVAAVGSLSAAKDGLVALRDATFPGKVVIFPQIKEFPLTSLAELKEKLPSVWSKLKDGREWTVEAEEEFLRIMLP